MEASVHSQSDWRLLCWFGIPMMWCSLYGACVLVNRIEIQMNITVRFRKKTSSNIGVRVMSLYWAAWIWKAGIRGSSDTRIWLSTSGRLQETFFYLSVHPRRTELIHIRSQRISIGDGITMMVERESKHCVWFRRILSNFQKIVNSKRKSIIPNVFRPYKLEWVTNRKQGVICPNCSSMLVMPHWNA